MLSSGHTSLLASILTRFIYIIAYTVSMLWQKTTTVKTYISKQQSFYVLVEWYNVQVTHHSCIYVNTIQILFISLAYLHNDKKNVRNWYLQVTFFIHIFRIIQISCHTCTPYIHKNYIIHTSQSLTHWYKKNKTGYIALSCQRGKWLLWKRLSGRSVWAYCCWVFQYTTNPLVRPHTTGSSDCSLPWPAGDV